MLTASLLAASALAACGTATADPTAVPPLVLGPARVLELDATKVPQVDACAPGQVLAGRACVDAAAALAPEPLAPRGAASDLAATLGLLEPRVAARLGCATREAGGEPEFVLQAVQCLPWTEAPGPRPWWALTGGLKFRYEGALPVAGTFRVTCALLPTCGEWDGRWDTLSVTYNDPDTTGDAYEVTAELYAGDQPVCGPRACALSSSAQTIAGETTMTLDLGGFRPDLARAWRDPSYYRVELIMRADARDRGELQLAGLQIR